VKFRFSQPAEPFSAARKRAEMPAIANAICSMSPKLFPLRTAKPLSMEAAAEASSRKYHVLRVNLSFISSLPPAERAQAPHQFLEFFKYYNTI